MTLKTLADIKAPELVKFNRQSFIDEIVERIKMHPDWDEIYDGDLHQNASQMILNLFAYMAEKNSESFNIKLKEKFFKHAFSEEAIFQNLADRNINIRQSTNAQVELTCTLENKLLRDPLVFDKFYQIPGVNANSASVIFELINKNVDGTYDYISNVIINPDTFALDYFKLTAYAGITSYETYEIDETMLENFKIEMDLYNVEEGSVQVFYRDKGGQLVQLKCVDTFNITEYETSILFPNGKPNYQLKYNSGGQPVVMFGSEEFGGAFTLSHVNGEILIYARTSYGKDGMVLSNGVNYTDVIEIINNESVVIKFINESAAYGGSSMEDIYIAKEYGPLRFGRDGGIIDKQDAYLKLAQLVVKHYITTPKFTNDQYNLPVMHALHNIVPTRDFNEYTFPDVDDNETITTYIEKIIESITDYCNVTGMHDVKVTDEFVSNFAYPDSNLNIQIDYFLKNKNLLSGSLSASAFDEEDNIVDYIKWDNNYITTPSSKAAEHNKVTRVRTKTFASINIIDNLVNTSDTTVDNGKNNLLYIEFDDYNYVFRIYLPLGSKSYRDFAKIINNLVISEIKGVPSRPKPVTVEEIAADPSWGVPVDNMLHLVNHNFVTYEVVSEVSSTGRLIFNSTKVGRRSKIVFHDYNVNNVNQSKDLYYLLGVSSKIYRPGRETGWVFSEDSTFDYSLSKINLKIFNENLYKLKTFTTTEVGAVQNSFVKTGPIIKLILNGENAKRDVLFLNYDVEVFAIDEYTELVGTETVNKEKVVGHLLFAGIANSTENSGVIGSEDPTQTDINRIGVFKSSHNFNYETSELTLNFVDGIEQPYYDQSFKAINYLRIVEIDNSGNEVLGTEMTKYAASSWSQNPTSVSGPNFDVDMSSYNFYTGKNYKIELINVDKTTFASSIIDWFIYRNIDTSLSKIIHNEDMPTGTVLYGINDETYLNCVNKIIHIRCVNGSLNSSGLKTYTKKWEDFDRIEVRYYRKNFEYITVNYVPNVYKPEKEAKALMDILGYKENKIISLENIMGGIKFIPYGINITLTVKKNYSLNDAVSAVRNLIMSRFGYDNTNELVQINYMPTTVDISNEISLISKQYGIVGIYVDDSMNTYNQSKYEDGCYYFILSEDMLKLLVDVENNNSDLSGLSSQLKINISANFE